MQNHLNDSLNLSEIRKFLPNRIRTIVFQRIKAVRERRNFGSARFLKEKT